MRVITEIFEIYKFEELSSKAQSKALDKLYYINVEYGWYETTCEDIANFGMVCSGFDTYRREIDIEFIDELESIANKLISEYGNKTEIYLVAKEYLSSFECYKSEEVFKREIETYFLKMLISEYEYLTSKEAIVETIESNEYEFYKNGEIYTPRSTDKEEES